MNPPRNKITPKTPKTPKKTAFFTIFTIFHDKNSIMNNRFSTEKQAIPLASLDRTIEKLRVYADDAFEIGDYLVYNSLEQTIMQAKTLRTEIGAATLRHDGDIPAPVWDILAQGYNQIIDRGEYLADLAKLHEQATPVVTPVAPPENYRDYAKNSALGYAAPRVVYPDNISMA
jgi:hypothetical protein